MNDEKIKFSVIIPVYNVEQYLEECLDSMINQTYRNIEIILVDDGSTDKSPQICEKYADADDRVIVIHKSNGGLPDARNDGIDIASGDYIAFVDSDDYIEPDTFMNFEKCISMYRYPEVLITTLIYTYPDRDVINDSQIEAYFRANGINRKSVMQWETEITKDIIPAVKKICKSGFLKQHHLRFCSGRLHEDIDWTVRLYYHANSFGICGNPWYHYRMRRKGSITNTVRAKNFTDIIEMGKYHFDYLKQHNTKKDKEVARIYFLGLYNMLRHYHWLTQEDRKKVIDCINRNLFLFAIRFAPDLRFKVMACAMKLLGAENAFDLIAFLKSKINILRGVKR